jgi:hypothetical protein
MAHLTPERLAELADNEPNTVEVAHLAACGRCARERDAYRVLGLVAREARRTMAPPLSTWGTLATQLREEGQIRPTWAARASWAGGRWARTAAAVLLVATGVTVGRWSAGVDALRPGEAADLPLGGGDVASASEAPAASQQEGSARFASVQQALATLSRAERDYRDASAFLAAQDTAADPLGSSTLYRTRLAALDAMAEVARQAVGQAPHDPVVNQYYLSTLGAREATLRQLGTTLPAGARLTGF